MKGRLNDAGAWLAAVAWVILLAPALAPGDASAQGASGRPRVVPLRVTSSQIPAGQLQALTESVLGKVRKYPVEVLAPPPEDPVDLMVDAECTDFDAECLSRIGQGRNADLLLYAEVGRKGDRLLVQVRLVELKTRQMKASEGDTDSEEGLSKALERSLEAVLGPEPSTQPEPVRVEVASTPAGAEVYLDQDFKGLSPVTLVVLPGTYSLRLAKVGYREVNQRLTVEPRKAGNVVVPLEAVPAVPLEMPTSAPKQERKSEVTPFYQTWWFWTVVGAVVVGGATTAGVLLSKDQAKTGSAGFSSDPRLAPKDVTLYPR